MYFNSLEASGEVLKCNNPYSIEQHFKMLHGERGQSFILI